MLISAAGVQAAPATNAFPFQSAVVVGAGLVGLATAHALLQAAPDMKVTVLEKEGGVGRHQSGHNSGVLHAGLYYRPGSLKARLAVEGLRRMVAFCQEHGVPYRISGKLVVATVAEQLTALDRLLERGRANGLSGVRRLTPAEMREIEPHVGGAGAIHVPEEGVVSFPEVCSALANRVGTLGGRIVTAAPVFGIARSRRQWTAETSQGAFSAQLLINCAGLHCDQVARLAGERPPVRIVAFRGDYFTITPNRAGLVRNLIYPVPDPAFPFLGVHFTRRVTGEVEAGPNAVLALAREGYRGARRRAAQVAEQLSFPGVWNFAARHAGHCVAELARSWSRRRFAAALRQLVPELLDDDLAPGGSGVRAQAMTRSGSLVDDFLVLERPAALHVLNAPSPAATASLAIADTLVERCRALA